MSNYPGIFIGFEGIDEDNVKRTFNWIEPEGSFKSKPKNWFDAFQSKSIILTGLIETNVHFHLFNHGSFCAIIDLSNFISVYEHMKHGIRENDKAWREYILSIPSALPTNPVIIYNDVTKDKINATIVEAKTFNKNQYY